MNNMRKTVFQYEQNLWFYEFTFMKSRKFLSPDSHFAFKNTKKL